MSLELAYYMLYGSLAAIALGAIGFIWGHNQWFCFHRFKIGGGLMGDSWRCDKCMLDKYPENIGFKMFYILLSRTKKL